MQREELVLRTAAADAEHARKRAGWALWSAATAMVLAVLLLLAALTG